MTHTHNTRTTHASITHKHTTHTCIHSSSWASPWASSPSSGSSTFPCRTSRYMDETHACMVGWVHGWVGGWMEGWMHAVRCRTSRYGWIMFHVCMGGWLDGWLDMDGWMNALECVFDRGESRPIACAQHFPSCPSSFPSTHFLSLTYTCTQSRQNLSTENGHHRGRLVQPRLLHPQAAGKSSPVIVCCVHGSFRPVNRNLDPVTLLLVSYAVKWHLTYTHTH